MLCTSGFMDDVIYRVGQKVVHFFNTPYLGKLFKIKLCRFCYNVRNIYVMKCNCW